MSRFLILHTFGLLHSFIHNMPILTKIYEIWQTYFRIVRLLIYVITFVTLDFYLKKDILLTGLKLR